MERWKLFFDTTFEGRETKPDSEALAKYLAHEKGKEMGDSLSKEVLDSFPGMKEGWRDLILEKYASTSSSSSVHQNQTVTLETLFNMKDGDFLPYSTKLKKKNYLQINTLTDEYFDRVTDDIDPAIIRIYQLWNQKRVSLSNDRFARPVPTVHCPPGGGKSTLLTILAAGSRLNLCGQDSRNIFESFVGITVAFNHLTPLDSTEAGMSADRGLILRILFSLLCDQHTNSFLEFVSWVREFAQHLLVPTFTVTTLLQEIITRYQCGVTLVVDEIVKIQHFNRYIDVDPLSTVISAINNAILILPVDKYNVVLTTLDQIPLLMEQSKSGHPFDACVLAPIKPSEVLELVSAKVKKNCQNQVVLQFLKTVEFQRVVADCGGHPRSLRFLSQELINWAVLNTPTHEDLFKKIVANLAYNETITRTIIEPAIDLLSVKRSDTAELLKQGIYTNSLKKEDENYVPRMVPLVVFKWAAMNSSKDDLAFHLHAMSMLTTESGDMFEKWHAHWECIRSIMRNKEMMKLKDYYRGLGKHTRADFLIEVRQKRFLKLNVNSYPKEAKTPLAEQIGMELTPEILTNLMIVIGKNNPGFDSVEYFKVCSEGSESSEDKYLTLNLENKYSSPETTQNQNDILTDKQIDDKSEKTKKQYGGQTKGIFHTMKSAGKVFVIIAWRTKVDETSKQSRGKGGKNRGENKSKVEKSERKMDEDEDWTEEGENKVVSRKRIKRAESTIIFDRPQLKQLYGYTLACRPNFIVSYEKVLLKQQSYVSNNI